MAKKRFTLNNRVNTDNPAAVEKALKMIVIKGRVRSGVSPGELLVEAEMQGESARALNRAFLSTLRRAEKKTRLRAEWKSRGTTDRFFDYVPKGTGMRS